ncbi:MAG: M23 family metallopeptidase [Polyangiaceae bacterium]
MTRFLDAYGIRSATQVRRDLATMVRGAVSGTGYSASPSTLGLFRPELSLPAYAGQYPSDRTAPIFNHFDRVGGGKGFEGRTSRDTARDYRGGRLSYDQHDGTDFVCPPGTPLVAAAPGVAVAVRDTWLRGGITLCLDHGHGVITQYTHLSRVVVTLGQFVQRGEVVARSGVGGVDMLMGAPWVPPHVHFMVWVDGVPVDPYLADAEPERNGVWVHRNDPRSVEQPLDTDRSDLSLANLDSLVDLRALERALDGCTSPRIRDEILRNGSPAGRLAIVEDSVHHDRFAWAEWVSSMVQQKELRMIDDGQVRLTLPLTHERYARAVAADSRWTRP